MNDSGSIMDAGWVGRLVCGGGRGGGAGKVRRDTTPQDISPERLKTRLDAQLQTLGKFLGKPQVRQTL